VATRNSRPSAARALRTISAAPTISRLARRTGRNATRRFRRPTPAWRKCCYPTRMKSPASSLACTAGTLPTRCVLRRTSRSPSRRWAGRAAAAPCPWRTTSPLSATGTRKSPTRNSRRSRQGFEAPTLGKFYPSLPRLISRNEAQGRSDDRHRGVHPFWRVDDTPVVRLGTRHHHDAAIGGSLVNACGELGEGRLGFETSGLRQGQGQDGRIASRRWDDKYIALGISQPCY